jgi:alanine racemase
MRPTWAEVSLTKLRQNFRAIQDHVGDSVVICAVLKGNAWGHGAVECAQALDSEGAQWFAVTSTEEGVRLRDAGISNRILLLTGYWQGEEEEVVGRQLTPAVWEPWHIARLAKAINADVCCPFPVHIKVDTGLTRLGVSLSNLPALLQIIRSIPSVSVEGLYTHLSSAEVLDDADAGKQVKHFETARDVVLRAGFSPLYFHVANSAAIAARPETWNNMVRPGISLFGYYPQFVCNGRNSPIATPAVEPILSWKTRIIATKEVGANQRVGYNGLYVTTRPTRLAVLPVGFADGFSRQLSLGGRAIVRNAFAFVVGAIAMDITLLDITGVGNSTVGDEVILIGSTEQCRITAWEHAEIRRTVPDEVLSDIASRVPRRYTD